jgi:hypothetical protein
LNAPTPDPSVSTRSSVAQHVRLVTLVATALVVLFASVHTVDAGLIRRRPNQPEIAFKISRTPLANSTITSYQREGIRFTPGQTEALRRLIGRWEHRADIRKVFSLPDGRPNVVGLIRWADANGDPDAITFASFRADLDEAAARIGVMVPDGEMVAVLSQTLAMRPRPVVEGDGAMWVIRNVWRARPDLQKRFLVDGRVNVRALLNWVANAPRTDPAYKQLEPISLIVNQILDELPSVSVGG